MTHTSINVDKADFALVVLGKGRDFRSNRVAVLIRRDKEVQNGKIQFHVVFIVVRANVIHAGHGVLGNEFLDLVLGELGTGKGIELLVKLFEEEKGGGLDIVFRESLGRVCEPKSERVTELLGNGFELGLLFRVFVKEPNENNLVRVGKSINLVRLEDGQGREGLPCIIKLRA